MSADSESESAEWACAPDFKVPTPSRQMEMPFHLSLPSVDVSEISSAFSENTDTDISQKKNPEQNFVTCCDRGIVAVILTLMMTMNQVSM